MYACRVTCTHAGKRTYLQYTINMGISTSLIYTHIDASYKKVLGSLLQHSTSAPQPSSFCTQGTVHQARAGEAVGVPQAGSSPSSQLWSGWDTKETTGL